MSISTRFSDTDNKLTIEIQGRFDFNVYKDFRLAYENRLKENPIIVIDFSKTEYIDSSALGMLLVLREQAGGDNAKIKIISCNDEIKKILSISNFGILFEIQ